MALNLNSESVRFDRRLINRNLREGRITLEELNGRLDALEDVSHLAILPDAHGADEVEFDESEDEED